MIQPAALRILFREDVAASVHATTRGNLANELVFSAVEDWGVHNGTLQVVTEYDHTVYGYPLDIVASWQYTPRIQDAPTIMAENRSSDQEEFDNYFHRWLGHNGVTWTGGAPGEGMSFRGMVNLQALKLAITNLENYRA